VPLLFALVFLALPVARLLFEGLWGEPVPGLALADTGPWWRDAHLQWRVGWTLAQALTTWVLCVVLGLPLAGVLARLEFTGRRAWQRALMLPFVVPTLVAALGVLSLWGPRGWLGEPLAQAGVSLQDGPWLLLLGNLFFNLGLVVRAGSDGLAQVSAQQVALARTLGSTPWRAFWRVEWPVVAPWLASAVCLVFLYCFTGFGLALGWRIIACSANYRFSGACCSLEPMQNPQNSVLAQLVVCNSLVGGHLLVVVYLIAHLWRHARAIGHDGCGCVGCSIGLVLRGSRLGHSKNIGF
jgi:ABC-type Fe3+ transport system permease subunit